MKNQQINIKLNETELMTIIRELGKAARQYKKIENIGETVVIGRLLSKLEPEFYKTDLGLHMAKYIGSNFVNRKID